MPRPRKTDKHLPPGVYRRHGAYYHVVAGKWRHLGRDLSAALAAYGREVEARREVGRMDALLDGWLGGQQDLAAATRRQYGMAVARLKAILAEFEPHQVTGPAVAQLLEHVGRDTPNAANRLRSVLKGAMDRAVLMGLAESNPVRSVPRRRERRRGRHLTDGELAAIHASAPERLQVIIDLARVTGQRIGDLLALRWSAVSEQGVEFAQQKTGHRLMVAMTPELAHALERARGLGGALRSLHVICTRRGQPYSYRGLRDLWARACDRAGVEDAHLHDLRARAAHDARAQGLDATALLGHASPSQTRRYLRDRSPARVEPPRIGQRPIQGKKKA